MANSFSPVVGVNIEDFSLESLAHSLGPTSYIEILRVSDSLGPLLTFEVKSVELAFGATNYVDVLDFVLGGAQVITMAGEIIHKSETSELQVTNLVLTDKSGTGASTISSPSGTAYQFRGARVAIENNTQSYIIPQHKSGYVWTNTGAALSTTGVLPSNALEGTSAYFIRTGEEVYIDPGASAQIYIPESGFFRGAGQMAHLASSGARMALISDGDNKWYPLIELGVIE